jgi:hypothetical protein
MSLQIVYNQAMKIKDICVSLELAKKLEKAGYPQESLFYWCENEDTGEFFLSYKNEIKADHGHDWRQFAWYSAPTASELGEALPREIEYQVDKNEPGFRDYEPRISVDIDNNWLIRYGDFTADKILIAFKDKSEANARAKMWLYLKSNNLL